MLKVYLSALRSLHICMGFTDPFLNPQCIPMVLKGVKRLCRGISTPGKLPIMALVMYSIKLQLDLSWSDDVMFWAACCISFFGFLRASEFTVPTLGFDSNMHLTLYNVTVDSFPLLSSYGCHIRKLQAGRADIPCIAFVWG